MARLCIATTAVESLIWTCVATGFESKFPKCSCNLQSDLERRLFSKNVVCVWIFRELYVCRVRCAGTLPMAATKLIYSSLFFHSSF
jgi:hypothetical protein